MDELLASIAKLLGEGKSPADIGKAIQAGAQPVYQYAFDRGHSDATQRSKEKLTEVETQLATTKGELTTATATLTDLQSKAPDVKKITDQFQAQITDLKAKHKVEVDGMKSTVTESTLSRARADLKSALIAKGVDPDYADVLVNKGEIKARMKTTEVGGIEVMTEGRDIPLTAGEGQTPLGLFADELSGKVPAKFLSSNADRGSGVNGGPSKGSDSADQYKKIREDVAAKNKNIPTGGIDAIAGRMGTARPTAATP